MPAGLSVGIALKDNRTGVRMTTDQLWVGVDVGKEHHWVCVVDGTGTVVISRKLVNDEQAIHAVIAAATRVGVPCPGTGRPAQF